MKRSLLLPLVLLALAACSDYYSIRHSNPLLPVAEYERMIVGRLDADYVGDENCLAKCHKHDRIQRDFELSVHGAQIESETGLPLVNCESCHGPGSLAVQDAAEQGRCAYETLLPLEELPAQAQALICLKCHSAASTPNLQYWSAGTHSTSDVSCFDCHQLHQGPEQKASRKELVEICYRCHQDVRVGFQQVSHHPLPEGKMVCIDCHDPHGTAQQKMLKESSVRDLCTRCHMEKQGPFVYEHADVTEDCTNCHRPHGSPNDPLLAVSQPFLCMQCHAGHLSRGDGSAGGDNLSARGTLSSRSMKQAFFNRCTDCHSAIHGTDIPSAHGRGSFIAR